MKYLPKELAREIRGKSKLVEKLDSSESIVRQHIIRRRAIKKNAQIHSYKMENPRARIPFCIPRNKNRKDIKEGIKKIIELIKLIYNLILIIFLKI